MNKIAISIVTLILSASKVQAGFIESQFPYAAGSQSALAFATEENNYNTPCDTSFGEALYAAPLPVAAHHPYATFGYSAPSSVTKVRNSGGAGFRFGGPFRTYALVRSHHKSAFPAPVHSLYNAPPPVNFAAPDVSYGSGFEASPNTVLKFGPPITTTTTSYSTTAAAGVHAANSFRVAAGW